MLFEGPTPKHSSVAKSLAMEQSTAASSRPSCSARAALRTMSRAATSRVAISASRNCRYCQSHGKGCSAPSKGSQHPHRALSTLTGLSATAPPPAGRAQADTLPHSGKVSSLVQGRGCEVRDGSPRMRQSSALRAELLQGLPGCWRGVPQTVCGQ